MSGHASLSSLPWNFDPIPGHGLPLRGCMITHTLDTPHSIGLLYTSDQHDAKTSTWQNTSLTKEKHPLPWRDSNPQSQQDSGCSPTPSTARSLGSVRALLDQKIPMPSLRRRPSPPRQKPITAKIGEGKLGFCKLNLTGRHHNNAW